MNEQSIKAAFRKFVSNGGEVLDIVLCNVVEGSVDTSNWICSGVPISGDNGSLVGGENVVGTLLNIQLTAQKASNGVIPIPADGSQILVLTTVRLDKYCILCSEIIGWGIYIEESPGIYTRMIVGKSEIDQVAHPGARIQLNDGSYNGLLIGLNTAQRFNLIENDINNLKLAFTALATALAALVTAGDAPLVPSALITAMTDLLTTYPATPLVPTTEEELENPTIVHGQ